MQNSVSKDALLHRLSGEKCGVVAVWDGGRDAPLLAKRALHALQHRGQESAGITVFKKTKGLVNYKRMGLITDVITYKILKKIGKAKTAIAQNRYSTTGKSSLINCQPFVLKNKHYELSIGHNGNIPDLEYLHLNVGKLPKATSDTALLATLFIQNRHKYPTWFETFQRLLPDIKGAYCLVMLTEEGTIYAARDPYGVRPLCIGRRDKSWVIASETVGLDAINAHYVRDVSRGEIISVSTNGEFNSVFFGRPFTQKACLFEHIYFSRPDSFVNGKRIKSGREALGTKLAIRIKTKKLNPDVIIPIMYSGYFAARGVAAELNLPIVDAIITSNYFGRTFINPDQDSRTKAVNGKHNVVPDDIYGKKVLFVDDSLVRSTTSSAITQSLLQAGAREVYAAFSSPPIINPCDLGIDMKSKNELIASQWEGEPLHIIEKNVAQKIGAHEVIYLSLQDTIEAIGGRISDYYSYYFGGIHPYLNNGETFPRLKRKIKDKPKLAIFISGSGTNLQKIIDEVKNNKIKAEIICVISSKAGVYGLERAKKNKIPAILMDSTGTFKNDAKQYKFDKHLVQYMRKINPDVIVLAGWMKVLGDFFLLNMQKMHIPVINLHPALLTKDNEVYIQTSYGKLPIIRGIHAIKEAYEKNLPLSGVSVHQILPGNFYDTGPIILQEEIRRRQDESLQEWEDRIHEVEYRVLPTAINRVLHVITQGIDISKGEYTW